MDLDTFGEKPEQDLDWKNEVQELLGPVLQELKNLTARPRQLERLRSELSHYENLFLFIDNFKRFHRNYLHLLCFFDGSGYLHFFGDMVHYQVIAH